MIYYAYIVCTPHKASVTCLFNIVIAACDSHSYYEGVCLTHDILIPARVVGWSRAAAPNT